MSTADAVVEVFERRGAAAIAHPGGTLVEHLIRTKHLLRSWGASEPVALAGLCHAAYGTDGFATALFSLEQQPRLVELIGPEAEALVYLYASCDRAQLNPQLGRASTIAFRDRFTGATTDLAAAELREFMELTFANELDLVTHNPAFAAEDGPEIWKVFQRCRPLVSDAAYAAFEAFADALEAHP